MKIRPYISSDFNSIKTWINNEREHALWCANLISYPLEKHSFENTLKEFSAKDKSNFFVAVADGKVAGFYGYSVNLQTNEGKLKFIIISPELRNKGYGKEMLSLAIKNAFSDKTKSVELNVFSCNIQAKNCYLRAGFTVRSTTENAFCFKDETWARHNMVINK